MNRTNPHSRCILVVEDDFFIRDMLVELLEEEGYPVVSAANGHEALALLRETADPPALILLDLMMPVMDGRQFRSAQQDDAILQAVPVVVLTASSDNEELPASFQPAAYVPKPINLQLLLETVATHFNNHCSSGQ
ncbi:MAG: response regulator [Chloroflexota bacterium]|nr:response regulator [Chloroflexota bacterium]PLS79274.1 MAG: response regulator [Chloroflexota bacterium]